MSELRERNTVKQVAAFWGCSARTVQRLIATGALSCFRYRRIIRISAEQAADCEAQHEYQAKPESIKLPQRDPFEQGRIIAGRLLVECQEREAKRKAKCKRTPIR